MSAHSIAARVIAESIGGTADVQGDELPSTGYFVGGAGAVLVFPYEASVDVPLVKAFMARMEARYLGWWTDLETDKVYVDQVDWFDGFPSALKAAKARGEIAFWDVAGKREIRVADCYRS